MRMRVLTLLSALALLAGCQSENPVAVRDVTPPAAPRGVVSITGDHTVYLSWLDNTEADVAGYRVYEAPCAPGGTCPYTMLGSTPGVTFEVGGLTNGMTRFFAVSAVDAAGNESDRSYDMVFDTPRPEAFGQLLQDYYLAGSPASGWDFSATAVRPWDDPQTDVFFGFNGVVYDMFVPDFSTDIQDAGVASSLDAVDYAPLGGWSPSGSVEVIPGHCYIVWTRDDHYAKFRVTSVMPPTATRPAQVVFDWAYQVDPGNGELLITPGPERDRRPRSQTWTGKAASRAS